MLPTTTSKTSLQSAQDFSLARFPDKAATSWSDRVALIDRHIPYTYGQMRDRVRRLQTVFRDAGVEEGSRVGILALNSRASFEVFFAAAALGAVMVPINIRLSPSEVTYQLHDADMSFVVISETQQELAENAQVLTLTHWWLESSYEAAIAAAVPADSPQTFDPSIPVSQMYTSGTTGFAKGCIHSLGAWQMSTLNLAIGLRLKKYPVVFAEMPFFHAWGFGFALTHLTLGGTVVIPARKEEYWESIDRYGITSVLLPQTPKPHDRKYDTVSIVSGQGGSFGPAVRQLLDAAFPNADFYGVYGMTELTNIAIMTTSADEVSAPGTLGQALPGWDVDVVDERGVRVQPGETGELVLRGPQVSLGYYNNPEATAELFRGGWVHTGDLARLDDSGRIYFEDRSKDMIKSGGENVYSAEVERVLLSFPGVKEAAVFGIPDERWGEAVKAVVVFTPDAEADIEALDNYCLQHIAAYKRPRWYEVVTELPRSATMKILKRDLRDQHNPTSSIRLKERK